MHSLGGNCTGVVYSVEKGLSLTIDCGRTPWTSFLSSGVTSTPECALRQVDAKRHIRGDPIVLQGYAESTKQRLSSA
jgi:hypothetical protein